MRIVKKAAVLIRLVLLAAGLGGCEKDSLPDSQSSEDQILIGKWELVRARVHTYENEEHVSTEDSKVDDDYSIDHEFWMKGLVFKLGKRVVILFDASDTGAEERYQYYENELDYYLASDSKKLYFSNYDFEANDGVYEVITLSPAEMHLSTESVQWYGPDNITRFVTEYFYKKKDNP